MVISVATLNNQKAKPVFVPFLSPIILTIFSEVLRWPQGLSTPHVLHKAICFRVTLHQP